MPVLTAPLVLVCSARGSYSLLVRVLDTRSQAHSCLPSVAAYLNRTVLCICMISRAAIIFCNPLQEMGICVCGRRAFANRPRALWFALKAWQPRAFQRPPKDCCTEAAADTRSGCAAARARMGMSPSKRPARSACCRAGVQLGRTSMRTCRRVGRLLFFRRSRDVLGVAVAEHRDVLQAVLAEPAGVARRNVCCTRAVQIPEARVCVCIGVCVCVCCVLCVCWAAAAFPYNTRERVRTSGSTPAPSGRAQRTPQPRADGPAAGSAWR